MVMVDIIVRHQVVEFPQVWLLSYSSIEVDLRNWISNVLQQVYAWPLTLHWLGAEDFGFKMPFCGLKLTLDKNIDSLFSEFNVTSNKNCHQLVDFLDSIFFIFPSQTNNRRYDFEKSRNLFSKSFWCGEKKCFLVAPVCLIGTFSWCT